MKVRMCDHEAGGEATPALYRILRQINRTPFQGTLPTLSNIRVLPIIVSLHIVLLN